MTDAAPTAATALREPQPLRATVARCATTIDAAMRPESVSLSEVPGFNDSDTVTGECGRKDVALQKAVLSFRADLPGYPVLRVQAGSPVRIETSTKLVQDPRAKAVPDIIGTRFVIEGDGYRAEYLRIEAEGTPLARWYERYVAREREQQSRDAAAAFVASHLGVTR